MDSDRIAELRTRNLREAIASGSLVSEDRAAVLAALSFRRWAQQACSPARVQDGPTVRDALRRCEIAACEAARYNVRAALRSEDAPTLAAWADARLELDDANLWIRTVISLFKIA